MSENLQVKQMTTINMMGSLENLSAADMQRFLEFSVEQQNKVFPIWRDFSNKIALLNAPGTLGNMLTWLTIQCPEKYHEFLGLDKENQQQFFARWLKQRKIIKRTMFKQLRENSNSLSQRLALRTKGSNNSPSKIPSSFKSQTKGKRKAPVKKTPAAKKRKTQAEIKKQQSRRLCCLFHSVKCKDTKCSHKSCAYVKDLWKHIRSCKNSECLRTHCLSSRYLLSHFKNCEEKSCEICNLSRHFHPKMLNRAKVHREAEALMFLSNSN